MNESIKKELTEHIELMDLKQPDHNELFNVDYYIIGYYQAEMWLNKHNLSTFEAMGICNDYEREHFGEVQTQFDNAEKLVNHLAIMFYFSKKIIYFIL